MFDVKVTLALATAREDQSVAGPADCKSVNIYRQTGSAAPALIASQVTDGAAAQVLYTDHNVAAGTYGYSASEVDQSGVEGDISDVIPGVVPVPPSKIAAPTIVSVVIVPAAA